MIAEQKPFRAHAFEYACATNDVDHRLTKPKHPWTNGQVERMNRTIKDATVKRYFYESHDQLRTHLRDFVSAYNFARRLKTLKGLTPYEFVCKAWTSQPQQFKLNPLQQIRRRVGSRMGIFGVVGLVRAIEGRPRAALTISAPPPGAGQSSVQNAEVIVVRRSGLAARPPFSAPRILSLGSNSTTSCSRQSMPVTFSP